MVFSASPAGVIRAASLAVLAALCAARASAEAIPGPPIGVSTGDRASASCPLREGGSGNAVAFAAGVAVVAIAARRRGGDSDA
jgi:hypothetical protein